MSYHPDTLCREVYDLAKGYYNKSIGCKLAVYLTGVVSLFVHDKYSIAPIVALFFVLLSEFFQFLSDKYKGITESLRRKLDFHASFGWKISVKEISDILLKLPWKLQKKISTLPEEKYFMSDTEVGPLKSLENLEESAWWSKHLAKITYNFCVLIILFVVLVSVATLYVALNCNIDQQYVPKMSKIITSSIMVLFSIGLFRTAIGYFKFHTKSEQIDVCLPDKIKSQTPTIPECIKMWSEYHVARASAPLIPTIIWEKNKDRLNHLWEIHKRGES